MAPSLEVRNRIDELRRELDDAIENAKIRAKGDYWISFFLMLIALGASAVAGIGGLSEKFGSQLTGSLALIPGAIAVLASNLKFQQKSNCNRPGRQIAQATRMSAIRRAGSAVKV